MIAGCDTDWPCGGEPSERLDLPGRAGVLGAPDEIEDAVEAVGKTAKRRGGKLPPQVMVYFVMGLALLAEEDYEEVWAKAHRVARGLGRLRAARRW